MSPRFRIVSFVLFSLAIAGCKTSSSLAEGEAKATLAKTLFTDSARVQTVTFVSGAVSSQPLAIDQFLFAKHWSTCPSAGGALASAPVCSLDAEGASYGHTNGWVSSTSDACDTCNAWTIPVAIATLKSVDSINATDATHATATYTYVVVPNEFGKSFGEWTAGHAVAWCGPDPAAVGGWAASHTATAAFVKRDSGWQLASPPGSTFATNFANGTAVAKPCGS
jgi:hypothetical protein